MMQRSQNIGQLAAALAKAQGEIRHAVKDSANPFYHSKYADLAACWDAIRHPFSKNGLAIVQSTRTLIAEKVVEIETLLAHASGEWVSDVLTIPASGKDRFDAQTIGSASTYGCRYALRGFAGLAAEDDDGNTVVARPGNGQHQAVSPANLRAQAMAILNQAKDMKSLELAWKSLTADQRASCQNDLPALKAKVTPKEVEEEDDAEVTG